jgi:hypothetical protein
VDHTKVLRPAELWGSLQLCNTVNTIQLNVQCCANGARMPSNADHFCQQQLSRAAARVLLPQHLSSLMLQKGWQYPLWMH